MKKFIYRLLVICFGSFLITYASIVLEAIGVGKDGIALMTVLAIGFISSVVLLSGASSEEE